MLLWRLFRAVQQDDGGELRQADGQLEQAAETSGLPLSSAVRRIVVFPGWRESG
jgi:hypothetical protein